MRNALRPDIRPESPQASDRNRSGSGSGSGSGSSEYSPSTGLENREQRFAVLKITASRFADAQKREDESEEPAWKASWQLEARYLDAFWHRAQTEDRLALLKDATSIQLPAPARQREDVAIQNARASNCWACGSADQSLARHHIVPVANGGSDFMRNIVTICEECHSFVHGRSVLNTRTKPQRGLTSLADVVAAPEGQRRAWLEQFRRRVAAEKPRLVVNR